MFDRRSVYISRPPCLVDVEGRGRKREGGVISGTTIELGFQVGIRKSTTADDDLLIFFWLRRLFFHTEPGTKEGLICGFIARMMYLCVTRRWRDVGCQVIAGVFRDLLSERSRRKRGRNNATGYPFSRGREKVFLSQFCLVMTSPLTSPILLSMKKDVDVSAPKMLSKRTAKKQSSY